MVDEIANQIEIQKVNVKPDSKSRRCERKKGSCLTPGGLMDKEFT